MARRTQADRTASTRAALIAAARRQFAEHGFASVGTEAIVSAADVSRGALYHHFADKTDLFAAVFQAVEAEVGDRIANNVLSAGVDGFVPVMMGALSSWLDACEAPGAQRILLLDGPSVLGWERWRELGRPYVLSLMEAVIQQAMAEGAIDVLPVRPLAHTIGAAAEEAAMYVLAAPDRSVARHEMMLVLERLLGALAQRS